jgi:hypothetical protein
MAARRKETAGKEANASGQVPIVKPLGQKPSHRPWQPQLAWALGQAGAIRESVLACNFVCPCTLQHLVGDLTIESLIFIPIRHD